MGDVAFVTLLAVIVAAAAAAVLTRGHLTAVILLSVFSVFMAVAFASLQAVDVAMAEAAIGAGLLTAIFVTALSAMRRRPASPSSRTTSADPDGGAEAG